MKSLFLSILICAFVATLVSGDDADTTPVDSKLKYNGYSGDIDARGRLINSLFKGYDKRNYPTDMTVKFGLSLLSYELNEERDSLEADSWLKVVWTDKRLSWDMKEFDVGVLRMDPDVVWKPDTTLYNSVDLPDLMKCFSTNVLIYPTGDVLWVPPCRLRAHCDHNLVKDPFGPQKCNFKFGSWTFDGLSMDLDFYNKTAKADITDVRESRHWDLISNEAVRIEKFYDCCTEPYVSLTFNLTLQRKVTPTAPTCL